MDGILLLLDSLVEVLLGAVNGLLKVLLLLVLLLALCLLAPRMLNAFDQWQIRPAWYEMAHP